MGELESSKLRLRRRGGVKLIQLDRASQLPALEEVDPKLWRVLSCPASGHEMSDRSTLAIDTDQDGRLRIRDIRRTIAWLREVLNDWTALEEEGDRLGMQQLRTDTPEGKRLRVSMQYLHGMLGTTEGDSLDLSDVARGRAIMAKSPLNGEGIIDTSATDDADIQALIGAILATVGGRSTRRGTEGVDRAKVEAFFSACEAFAHWHARGHNADTAATLFFLGEGTEPATDALISVEAKISEWFQLCKTQAFAPDLVVSAVNAEKLEDRPLAVLNSSAQLKLSDGLNPAWEGRMRRFVERCLNLVTPDHGGSINVTDWASLRVKFKPYREWRDGRVGSAVSGLGIDKVTTWLGSAEIRNRLLELIEKDCALRDDISGVDAVERCILLKRDFWEFIHNFVNFDRFYDLLDQAIFQIGVLYMDGRSLHLCVSLDDVARHATTAARSGLYLVYCRCSRKDQPNGPFVAAAVTNGGNDGLFVGKHGVFYDRDAIEWDAEVVRIIEHPINLRQAVFAPFKRLSDILIGHVESLSSAREKALQSQVTGGVKDLEGNLASSAAAPAAAPAPAARSAGGMGGLMAGGGFAVAAVTSSLAFLSATLAKIHPGYLLSAVLMVVLLIMLPTALVSWIRLRQRDIGKLLEANAWAINGRIPLTRQLGKSLTLRQKDVTKR